MTFPDSALELIELAAVLAASGAIAGLLAGLFGIGGGAVLVPVFYGFLGVIGIDEAVRMHLAVGTSIGLIVPTSLRSFLAHRARGAADEALLRSWIVAVPAGAAAATIAAAFISGAGLRGVFAVLAALVAVRMLAGNTSLRLGADIPGNPVRAAVGAGIGFVSTLMGVGGGVFNNVFMTLFGRPIHQAIATSAGVGVLIAIPAAIGYAVAGWNAAGLPPGSLGYVNLVGVAVMLPLGWWLAPVGVRLAHRAPRRTLEIGFGLFLTVVAVRFAWSLF